MHGVDQHRHKKWRQKYDGKVTILPEKGFRISGTETIIYRGDIDNNNTIAGQKLEPYIDPNNPPQPIVITKYVSSYEEFISAFASKKAKIVLDKDINYPLNIKNGIGGEQLIRKEYGYVSK